MKLLILILLIINTKSCNKLVCQKYINSCSSLCNCDQKYCDCCIPCLNCLGIMWDYCCDCFGMCQKIDITNKIIINNTKPIYKWTT